MAHYKHKVFEEETSSMGSVHLTEGVTASSTHIRFYSVKYIYENINYKYCVQILLYTILY